MHRANYTLQHHVQHPYGLHQRSQRKRTACLLVKLLLQYGGIALPPRTCLHPCQGITVPSCTEPKICVLGLIWFLSSDCALFLKQIFQEEPHIVSNVDVRPLRQQQLHQLDVLVLSGPDHRRPAPVVLGRERKG